MPVEITMPQLSDTMTDGKLIKWYKKEGDKIKTGDKIADVETDKAVMEMEALDSGTLAAILIPEGQSVPVGGALALLATGSEKLEDVKKNAGNQKPAAKAAEAKSVPAHAAPSTSTATAVAPPPAAPAPSPEKSGNGNDRVKISPVAKRLAQINQVDIQSLQGSGPGGRIVKEDILSARTGGGASSSPALPQRLGSGQKQVIPLTKMRAAIARSLQASKQNIPHFYETIDADVEELTQLRHRVNEILAPQQIRLSLGDFVSKAVAVALLRHPDLNATYDGANITRYGDVHLGMAVAIPDGLIVPVLKNIHLMGMKEIRQRTVDLVDRARSQKLKQDEMTGGTFTVSNLGAYGIREFSAIINPPQVAILAIGAAEQRAVVRAGQIVPRTMISLTISADHRAVDGATAADFMRTLKELLEEPAMMLA